MRAESEITQPIDRDELLGLLDTARPDAEQRITTEMRVPVLYEAPEPTDLPPAGFSITFKTKAAPPLHRYQTALVIAFSAAMFLVLGAAVALIQ